MAVPNHQLPGQQEPQTDSREWTTPDQKIHLQSRHGEYVIARDNSRLKTWFCTELRTYFDLFPTEPVTVIEGMLNPDWTIGDKRLFEEMRVKTWFKNHSRPSTQSQRKKREMFKINKRASKILSPQQYFSKIYYRDYYRKPITSKWRGSYMAYYHRTKKDLGLTVVDAKDIEKLIVKSMMEDNRAGLLDITAVAASGDEDKGEEERDQDEEHDEDVEVEDEDRGREEGNTFQDGGEVVKFPKVAMWYRNAIIDKCWNEATPSQKDAVDKRKMQGTNTKMAASADDDDKVTRLDEIILRRASVERVVLDLLNQIFEQTGLVGTVCLAGPDPQRGGKLMTMTIDKPFQSGQGFGGFYPHYRKAVSDPMRSFSSLFFPLEKRSEWCLPGTEQPLSQQEELAGLAYSAPALVKAFSPTTSTNPTALSSLRSPAIAHAHSESSTLRHQVIHDDVLTSGQVGPLPSQTPSISGGLIRDTDGGEMADGENISKWKEALDALQPFDDGIDDVNTCEEAMQAANTANSTGGDVAERRGSQTTPSTSPVPAVDRCRTPNAPGTVPSLQRVSAESGPEGEVNDTRDEDTTGLEQRPATRTTSRALNGLNTDTTAPSRTTRSKKIDASGPSTRATCAPSGNSRKRGRERGGNSEPPSKRPVTRSSQVKTRKRK